MSRPHQEIDRMLEELRLEPASLPSPLDFEAAVWRRIDRQREAASSGFQEWCERLAALVLQPRQVAAALVLVLCGAVAVTSIAPRQHAPQAPGVLLGLDVFSGHAPALPSTLMARNH